MENVIEDSRQDVDEVFEDTEQTIAPVYKNQICEDSFSHSVSSTSSINNGDEEIERNPFERTICSLQGIMSELEFMNSDVKEIKELVDELYDHDTDTTSNVYDGDEITRLEDFIDNMNINVQRYEIMRPNANQTLSYNQMLFELKSEILNLEKIKSANKSMLNDEIMDLKEDITLRNNFIKHLLDLPINNRRQENVDKKRENKFSPGTIFPDESVSRR